MKILKHNRGVSGFTVMELVVVIALAMLVTGIAVPSLMAWLPTLRLSNAARQVATDLQVARMKAISQNTKFRINFVSTTTYRFERDTNNNGTYEIPSEIESGPFSLPEGIDVTTIGATWEFQPRGTAASNAGAGSTISSITFQNSGNETKTVEIALVGRVKIL